MMEDVNYCCLFCYRTFAKEVKVTPGENAHETQVQFLLLLKRYLIHGHDADSGKWIKVLSDCITANESLRNAISPCDVCSGVIKSFCECYDELKVLELKLKWKLETLTNIVKGSEKVKLRRRLFRAKLKESMDHDHDGNGKSIISDIMKQLRSFRTDFVMKCASRFKDCYPKVKLRRCDCSGSNTRRTALKRRHDQDVFVFDDNQNKKVPRLNELEMDSSGDKVALHTELLNDSDQKVESLGKPVPLNKLNEGEGESNAFTGVKEASMTGSSVSIRDGDLESGIEGGSAPAAIDDSSSNHHSNHTDNECENRTISSQEMNPDSSEVNDSSTSLGGDKLNSANQTGPLHNPISIAVATVFDASLKLNKERETSLNTNPFPVDADVSQISQSDMNPGTKKVAHLYDCVSRLSVLNKASSEPSHSISPKPTTISVVNPGHLISLRQRYPCRTCSKKFSSSGKLKEHMENCIDRESGSDDESETNQCSDNDNDFGNDEDMDIDNEDDDDDKWDGEEDFKPLPIESKEEGRDKIRRRKVPKRVENSHSAREEDRFICEVEECKKNCASARKLIEHMAVQHSKKTTNKCCFCSQKFPSRIHLIFHQNQIHQQIPQEWESKDTKPLSKTEQRRKEVFKCPTDHCNERFYFQRNLDSHSLLHGHFKCLFCEETRTYAPDLALHEASSHKLENVMIKRKSEPHKDSLFCARCDYATRSETHYVQHHLESHLNLKMVVEKVCCICKVVFKGGINFRQTIFFHYVTHHELKDKSFDDTVHRCDHSNCEGVYFLKRKQLSSHKALIHQEILTKFPCNLCNKEFPDSHNRDRHRMTRHKNELNLPIACSQEGCWMRFDNEHSLKLHLSRKHSTNQSQLCPQCGKSFQGLAALSSHIHRAHKSESQKPKEKSTFVCSQCGKTFGQKEQLNLHVLGVHIGPEGWKHICSTCGKKCLTSGKLEEHKRTHTKEKPFTCEHCGLSYAHRHNFRHHLKNKHGIVLEPPKRSKKIKE